MHRQDVIERTIEVSHPIDKVWEAITVAERLGQWFGDSAEVDLRPGGAISFGWSDYGDVVSGVVEEVEPPTRFSYRWEAGADAAGRVWTTKVSFVLEESAGMTTITVKESGLSVLPDELYNRTLEENSAGWKAEFADLYEHLTAAVA